MNNNAVDSIRCAAIENIKNKSILLDIVMKNSKVDVRLETLKRIYDKSKS